MISAKIPFQTGKSASPSSPANQPESVTRKPGSPSARRIKKSPENRNTVTALPSTDGAAPAPEQQEIVGLASWIRPTFVKVATKSAGDYFGEIALVHSGSKRTAYVRAGSYCVVEKLTDTDFNGIIKAKHPRAYKKIVDRIATPPPTATTASLSPPLPGTKEEEVELQEEDESRGDDPPSGNELQRRPKRQDVQGAHVAIATTTTVG